MSFKRKERGNLGNFSSRIRNSVTRGRGAGEGGKGASLETRRASMAERCFHAADVTCFEQV